MLEVVLSFAGVTLVFFSLWVAAFFAVWKGAFLVERLKKREDEWEA